MNTLLQIGRGQAALEISIMLVIAFIIGFVTAWLIFRNRLKVARERHQQSADLLKQQLEAANGQAGAWQRQLAEAKARNEQLQTTSASQKKLLQEDRERLGELQKRLAGTSQALEQREIGQAELNRLMTELQKEIELNKAQLQKTEKALENSQKEERKAQEQIAYYQKQVGERDGLLLDMKEQLSEKEDLMAKMKSQLQILQRQETRIPEMNGKPDKERVLQAISLKKANLNFDSFGVASAGQKDDLKRISGIGPFIEEKLNALDIYTFLQISRFSEEDVQKITEAIAFFPGRIQRDNWIGQARQMAEKQKNNNTVNNETN